MNTCLKVHWDIKVQILTDMSLLTYIRCVKRGSLISFNLFLSHYSAFSKIKGKNMFYWKISNENKIWLKSILLHYLILWILVRYYTCLCTKVYVLNKFIKKKVTFLMQFFSFLHKIGMSISILDNHLYGIWEEWE